MKSVHIPQITKHDMNLQLNSKVFLANKNLNWFLTVHIQYFYVHVQVSEV